MNLELAHQICRVLNFIYKTLQENNIEIPFPQMDVRVKRANMLRYFGYSIIVTLLSLILFSHGYEKVV